jgi:hypothetical protein
MAARGRGPPGQDARQHHVPSSPQLTRQIEPGTRSATHPLVAAAYRPFGRDSNSQHNHRTAIQNGGSVRGYHELLTSLAA